MTLNFGLEKSVLVQSSNERLFVNNLATEVGKLDNSEALSNKEAVIDAIKARLCAAKKSYVTFTDLADDSEIKMLKSQLQNAKKQLADLMIKLATQPASPTSWHTRLKLARISIHFSQHISFCHSDNQGVMRCTAPQIIDPSHTFFAHTPPIITPRPPAAQGRAGLRAAPDRLPGLHLRQRGALLRL